ncbi:MAG: hypothetical protein JNK05_39440 [Myxococcales bacterium]|nr:hypothetical protein [Myxococcales bacterium]
MNDELTTLKKVLIAAAMLDGDQQTFSAEDVIVRAWRAFPESFGLSGYREEHPDSNRVLAKLMGSLGLCGRGWLEQTNTKTYRLTPAGRKMARSLGYVPGAATFGDAVKPKVVAPVASPAAILAPALAAAKASVAPVVSAKSVDPAAHAANETVARPVEKKDAHAKERVAASALPSGRAASAGEPVPFDQSAMLARIATSIASQKFARGGMITLDDACAFWGISRTTSGGVLEARLEEFEDVLARAEKHVRKTGAPVRANGRFEVTLTTVVGLQGLHRMLLQRYQRELDVIRARE